jgi:hypothetical protein
LASGNSDFDSLDKTDSADRGKTGDKAKGKAKTAPMSKEELKLLDKARKTLATIVEHLPYLAFATNTKTVRESLEVCRNSKDYNAYVTHEFGVPPKTILELFDRGVLNYDLASLQKAGKQLNLANNS